MVRPAVRRLCLRGLWTLAGLALVLLLLRAFVADVYRVESGSMQPTLFGPAEGEPGEDVLVRYDADAELERFDLVVLLRRGQERQEVKRVAGLPGEDVLLTDGDLLIDGRRLGPEVPRPTPIPVFDDTLHEVSEEFWFKRAPDGPWSEVGDTWQLDGREVELHTDLGLMVLHEDLMDGWIERDGTRRMGLHQVNDGLLECEVWTEDTAGQLRFKLIEQDDTFEVRLMPGPEGRAALVLRRWNSTTLATLPGQTKTPEERRPVLAQAEVDFAPGAWHRVRFSNVDNALGFQLDGHEALAARYELNQPHHRHTVERNSAVPQLALGGEGLVARFRRIRVLRDRFWIPIPEGGHGIAEPIRLGPGQYFVLGDHSADSADSRLFGPVHRSEVLGRPVAVVWPPSRWRVLEGAQAPGEGD